MQAPCLGLAGAAEWLMSAGRSMREKVFGKCPTTNVVSFSDVCSQAGVYSSCRYLRQRRKRRAPFGCLQFQQIFAEDLPQHLSRDFKLITLHVRRHFVGCVQCVF